jgi:hypothetical protein
MVVAVPMVVMPMVVANAMMVVMKMMRSHLGRIRARRADDGHR